MSYLFTTWHWDEEPCLTHKARLAKQSFVDEYGFEPSLDELERYYIKIKEEKEEL